MSLKKNFSYLFIGLTLITGCLNKQQKSTEVKNEMKAGEIFKKPASSFGDTLVIEKISAVFFHPDSVQLEKYKAVAVKLKYATSEHDCFYQMRNARSVLQKNWPKINIVECRNARYILFIKKDNSKIFVDLDSRDICGLLLFDRQKDPLVTDMMNIDRDLEYYFRQH